ncbi:hypothetical protein COV04_01405 [Candidatus Uhrbacteria bacterium CG10_big_fil_rev_8_21_14_0_10_48_11]|uniref:Uncharacterized protein n=1 Tax=Candidatus Uhrbacteria bacterium CG10_big_fil_rev_8_21_14_0_10_48_11 TaxID=1975037 RepID=A0A2M8LFG9_9BACT|nr:MAG: hypothetical protein COV04_01405 [Candidatus Uhrbacteria bacterium CG10_big_fil_rev_8_21_14_0_10_48_11]
MFLTVHASVGAVFGDALGDSRIAFGAGFASHFLVDAIPHGDERIGRQFVTGNHKMLLALLLFIDVTVAFLLLTLFWMYGFIQNPVAAYSGALGAVLPDILSGLTAVSKERLWPAFTRFHNAAHQFFKQEFTPLSGYVIQTATFAAVWLTRIH